MASRQAITTELSITLTLFNRKVDEEELTVLVLAWEEAFAHISDAEFISGCKTVRRRNRFFPVPAEVLAAIEDERMAWRPAQQALPPAESIDPQRRWRNMLMGKICILSVQRKCDRDLARLALDVKVPWDEREPFARRCLGAEFIEFETFDAAREEEAFWRKKMTRDSEL
jgi:hypothetical protein